MAGDARLAGPGCWESSDVEKSKQAFAQAKRTDDDEGVREERASCSGSSQVWLRVYSSDLVNKPRSLFRTKDGRGRGDEQARRTSRWDN